MSTVELVVILVGSTGLSGLAGAWLQHRRTPAEDKLTSSQADLATTTMVTVGFEKLLDNLRADYDRVTHELVTLREECQVERLSFAGTKRELEQRVHVLELEVAHVTTEVETYRAAMSPVTQVVAKEVIERLLAERRDTT